MDSDIISHYCSLLQRADPSYCQFYLCTTYFLPQVVAREQATSVFEEDVDDGPNDPFNKTIIHPDISSNQGGYRQVSHQFKVQFCLSKLLRFALLINES